MRQMKRETPKSIKKTIKALFQNYKRFIPAMVFALIFSVAGTLLSLFSSYKVSDLVDEISLGLTGNINIELVSNMCLFLIALNILSFVFGYLQQLILVTVSQKLSKHLRSTIFAKVNRIKLQYFDNNNFGDLLSRLINDIEMVSDNLSSSIASFASAIILLIGSASIMIFINWKLGLSAIACALVGFFVMTFFVSKSQHFFQENRKNEGELNGYVEEIYSGHKIVKSYNNEAHVTDKFQAINNKVCESAWKANALSSLMHPIVTFIGNASYVLICIMGAYMVSQNIITFGIIVSFVLLIKLFIQPLSNISQIITTLQTTLAAAERVFEFLENEELSDETHKKMKLKRVKGHVNFKHVRFGYEKNKTIIQNFTTFITSGQKIAIVGETGAGKTTLVNLLMRFYEMESGDIKIDNTSIKDITRENLHDLFAMVLQDTWIFEGTLRENLIYTTPNVTDAKLDKVCTELGLMPWIESLPDKYDTILSESTNFSGGQQQLITIARAMIKDAPLLILDEATSSIDTRSERIIQRAMDKLTKNRTSFIIAHRLSTIKNADNILVIQDGDIVEMGRHRELLNKNGIYASMYNSQFTS